MVGWHHLLSGQESELRETVDEGKTGVLQSVGSQKVRHN